MLGLTTTRSMYTPGTSPSVANTMTIEESRGIHVLPPELVSLIFSFTHQWDDRNLAIVHTLVRVCRLWRDLSHATPELWTDVRILHLRRGQTDLVRESFRRSTGLPLDISLDIPIDVVGNDQLAIFWPILMKIWDEAHRWRRLRLSTTPNNFRSIMLNVGCKDAPRLEYLELIQNGVTPSGHRNTLSFGSSPLLKSITLRGVVLKTSELSFVDCLETLDLSHIASANLLLELADSFHQRHPHSTPRLRHLILHSCASLPIRQATERFTSYTSSLTKLTLASFHSHQTQSLPLLCTSLRTPFLQELSLHDLSPPAWRSFTDSLSSESAKFPSVQALHLSSIADCEIDEHFVNAFPALSSLTLHSLRDNNILSLLSDADQYIWPKLRTLSVNPADYRQLCSVVGNRIALGLPIMVLEVDSPPVIDINSLRWLQGRVETFNRAPRVL
ncbi:hypothetical protein C8J57DRAFT_1271493 [Mycena rebaudengoi]|nr:hypothetical protein C8J57DRAFT_1271493 [Mycena rebaudengoi]